MKIKNIILSILIIAFGVFMFVGCDNNVKLTLDVDNKQGTIILGYAGSVETQELTEKKTVPIAKNKKVVLTAIPNDANSYQFHGWFDDKDVLVSDKVEYTLPVTKDRTLVAKFIKISYTISLNFNGGKDVTEATGPVTIENVKSGDTITLPVLTKENEQFFGWYYGDIKIGDGGETPITIPSNLTSGDKENKTFTLTAKFKQQRIVTYVVEGRNNTPQSLYQGDTLEYPQATKEGYRFIRWKTNDNETYSYSTLVNDEDLTLIAEFAKEYTISFVNLENNPEPIKVIENENVPLTRYYPTYSQDHPEHKVVGFKVQGTDTQYKQDFTFTLNTDIVLEAIISQRYNVKFYTNGGIDKYLNQGFVYQNDTYGSLPVPTRTAPCSSVNSAVPNFRCWTYKNQIVTADTVFTEGHDVTLIAMWDVYQIKYHYLTTLPSQGAVVYDYCAVDQELKDALIYKAYEQREVVSNKDLYDATDQYVYYYSLDKYCETKISTQQLFSTIKDLYNALVAESSENVGTNGSTFKTNENNLPFTFKIADEEGNPVEVEYQWAEGYTVDTESNVYIHIYVSFTSYGY